MSNGMMDTTSNASQPFMYCIAICLRFHSSMAGFFGSGRTPRNITQAHTQAVETSFQKLIETLSSLKSWAEMKRFWADVARNFDDIPTYSGCQRGFQLTIGNLTSAENLFTTFSDFLMKCCLFLFCGPFWGNGASRDHDPL